MSVGRLRPAGPADITKQTRNFQALKLSIRRNLPLPADVRKTDLSTHENRQNKHLVSKQASPAHSTATTLQQKPPKADKVGQRLLSTASTYQKKFLSSCHSSFHRWIFRYANYSYPAVGEPKFAECFSSDEAMAEPTDRFARSLGRKIGTQSGGDYD